MVQTSSNLLYQGHTERQQELTGLGGVHALGVQYKIINVCVLLVSNTKGICSCCVRLINQLCEHMFVLFLSTHRLLYFYLHVFLVMYC